MTDRHVGTIMSAPGDKTMNRKIASVIVAASFAIASPGSAATIAGLFNTGVGADGTAPLAVGTADAHYVLNGGTSSPIVYANPFYTTPGDAAYISAQDGGGFATSVNFYSLAFDLTGDDPSTAVISGRFAADDAVEIFLNNVDTGIGVNGFGVLTPFSVASGFVSGQNVLAFRVTDIQGPPSALVVDRIEGSVRPQATGAVPEPASWAMMLFGIGGVGYAVRRRPKIVIRTRAA